MSRSYHGTPAGEQQRHAEHPECLLLSYCHARTAGLPAGAVHEFCTRFLPLVQLADRLTTEIVLRTLLFPSNRSGE